MKNLIKISLSVLTLALFVSCTQDYDIGEITKPTNLDVTTEVVGQSEEMPNGDGSGAVKFSASADNAMSYRFIYGDGFEEVSASGETTHSFNKNGVNDYTVKVIASGTAGNSANTTETVTVFSDFSDPETKQLLTGGSTKTWYVAAAEPGHLGVGPSSGEGFTSPVWYAAVPFEKAGAPSSSCFYTDEMTFSLNANDNIEYVYNNNGQTFFNVDYVAEFGGSGEGDQCIDYDDSSVKSVSLSPATSGVPAELTTGTAINISDGGTMSYYIGASTYEVLSIDENTMHVRAIMGNNPALAWYLKFTTAQGEPEEEEEFQSEFNELVWSDEFDGDGTLNSDKWNFETGNNDGWGNQELQYYTEENAVIEDGILKINAVAESTNGFDYSSARITTMDKFEFTYGRVEVRAKMPEGGGTWPAIWMLGANFPEAGWPEAGEIDIMEYKGNEPGVVHGTLHMPGNFAGDAITETTTVSDAASEFHNYGVEWSEDRILFLVDDVVYHEFENTADSPFNDPFFLILNLAMGGTFGGDVAGDFSQATFEIDYVRVYQAAE
ncbi:family 16 glycosylhydrolase [Salegentibacter chungangensis]|uniref:Family 16 glycosylhydrolase n=1 Tax=Salegentibacter chungangensis TaxID=1335724 RepID=A0ABW3NR52_9FLAO